MAGTEDIPGASPCPIDSSFAGDSQSRDPSLSTPTQFLSLGLPQRLVLFVLLFAAEWSPITHYVHKGRGAGALLQIAIAFGSLLLAFGYFGARDSFRRISRDLRQTPIGWGFLVGHLAALAAFLSFSSVTTGRNASGYVVVALWYATGVLAVVLAGFTFISPKPAFEVVRTTGHAWVYALVAAVIVGRLIVYFPLWNGAAWNPAIDLSWKWATDLTFSLVEAMLRLFLSHVVADWTTMTIGSPAFQVTILPWCAGFEGTVLMLVFSVAWLGYFWREYRFPHALLLVPAGMLVIWLSNAVRITALILIGVAGAPGIAVGGFHSQAGWIAFNCVALCFAVLAGRLPWFAREKRQRLREATAASNPTAVYLVPFLTILAATMISRAASGGFEWLYPLRFVAAAIALWVFRSKYFELDWRFGGFSVLAGCLVFGLWLGLDLAFGAHASNGMAEGLASLPGAARVGWLVFRCAAAILTVPIAEELAFRGFLIRRLISPEFQALSPRQYTYVAVFVSSAAFGLLHGDRWLAGTLAGLAYSAAYLKHGRIGDAVAAHASTNALLAAWVLLGGNWHLW
jgi:exosortase E/protease (VPEID-CTERM system)